MLPCVNCSDGSCGDCDVRGKMRITRCPLEYVTPDVLDVIRCAELYEKGLPPVAGGSLDQTRWFVCAADFIFKELAYWKKKLRLF